MFESSIDAYFSGRDNAGAEPTIISALAVLPPDAIVSETELCHIFKRKPLALFRAVDAGLLPAPAIFFGEKRWLAGRLVAHFRKLAEAAENEHERKRATLKRRLA